MTCVSSKAAVEFHFERFKHFKDGCVQLVSPSSQTASLFELPSPNCLINFQHRNRKLFRVMRAHHLLQQHSMAWIRVRLWVDEDDISAQASRLVLYNRKLPEDNASYGGSLLSGVEGLTSAVGRAKGMKKFSMQSKH
jgi:hypothetical protein